MSTEPTTPIGIAVMLQVVRHALEQPRRATAKISSGSVEEDQLRKEADGLFQDRKQAREVIDTLFPQDVPITIEFYERIHELRSVLDCSELSQRIIGLIWSVALGTLPPDKQQTLLTIFPDAGNIDFFLDLPCLPIVLSDHELPAEFAVKWFRRMIKRIGNDLANEGFWAAVGRYCEQHPSSSLQIIHLALNSPSDDITFQLPAHMLGVLRSLPKDQHLELQFQQLENCFRNDPDSKRRCCYYRSWIQTAWRRGMTVAELQMLTDAMKQGGPADIQEAFRLVCYSLLSSTITSDSFRAGVKWLRSNVSSNLEPDAKYHVVHFVCALAISKQFSLVERSGDYTDLILSLMPISPTHNGTWQQLEHYLAHLLQTDCERFSVLVLRLAQKDARGWLAAFRTRVGCEWLLSLMRDKDLGTVVGQLLQSTDSECRKLGLLFFDELKLTSLPMTVFSQSNELQIKRMFYELQRSHLDGDAVGRHLALLAPSAAAASQSFQDEVREELVLQAKNYTGACQTVFRKNAETIPLLKSVLVEVEGYLDALNALQHSCINKMEIDGFPDAVRLFQRKMSNTIAKEVGENSIMRHLCKTVIQLYGKEWSIYHSGKLGTTSQLVPFSASVEIPRLEVIDPEGMALRRLNAINNLAVVSMVPDGENPQ